MKTSELRWKYTCLKHSGPDGKDTVNNYMLMWLTGFGPHKWQGEVNECDGKVAIMSPGGDLPWRTDMTVEQAKDFLFRRALENG